MTINFIRIYYGDNDFATAFESAAESLVKELFENEGCDLPDIFGVTEFIITAVLGYRAVEIASWKLWSMGDDDRTLFEALEEERQYLEKMEVTFTTEAEFQWQNGEEVVIDLNFHKVYLL